MSEKKVTLFGNKTLGPYKLSEIFDPDVDPSSPESSGKIVPAVKSLVIDDSVGGRNRLWVVTSVDQDTFKATLSPASVSAGIDEERIVGYGNDIYMLYYIPDTKKIIVDNKLTFFGNQGVKYQITKTEANGTVTVLSKYDEDMNPVDTIDLEMHGGSESYVKKCPPCYTDAVLSQGSLASLMILNSDNLVVAQVQVVVKNASGVLESTKNPVTDLTVSPNQEHEGYAVLLKGQDPNTLRFTVKVKYDDNTEDEIITQKTVTEIQQGGEVYIYGADQMESSRSGAVFSLLFKKYLPTYDYTTNHVSCLKNVKVVMPENPYGISKVSPIPIWSSTLSRWNLKLLMYYYDLNKDPEYVGSEPEGYDGTLFDVEQVLTVSTTHQNPYNETESYIQKFSITFNTPRKLKFNNLDYTFNGGAGALRRWINISGGTTKTILFDGVWKHMEGNTETHTGTNTGNPWNATWSPTVTCSITDELKAYGNVNWLISDYPNTSDIMYGNDEDPYDRPRIMYGSSGYVIPEGIFGSTIDGVGKFLNDFYRNAMPPKRVYEAFARMPTHFRMRDVDSLSVIQNSSSVSIVALEDWNDPLPFPSNATYSGKTVIVEFLEHVSGTTYKKLYGMPVEIVSM